MNQDLPLADTVHKNVLQLLTPESRDPYLEWPYFIFLIIIFVISTICVYRYLPNHWTRRLAKVKYDPNETIHENYSSLKEYAMTSLGDHILSAMPGIFLIVGLSGTFLSLSFVLNDMRGALIGGNTSAQNLEKILSELGSKFKISIWGIGFNLLYRIPYSWSMNRLNEQVKATLYHLKKEFARSQADASAKMDRYWTSLLSATGMSNGYLASLDSNFKDFRNVVTKLEKSVNDFGKTVTDAAQTLEGTTKEFVDTASTFKETIDRFEKNNTKALDEFTKSIGSFDQNITQAFKEFSDSVTKTLNGISETIKSATKESSEFIGSTLQELKPVIALLNEQMEAFKSIISDVEGVTTKLFEELKISNETNQRLAGVLEGNQAAMVEMSDRLNTMIEDFQANSGTETRNELLNRVAAILDELSNINRKLDNDNDSQ